MADTRNHCRIHGITTGAQIRSRVMNGLNHYWEPQILCMAGAQIHSKRVMKGLNHYDISIIISGL